MLFKAVTLLVNMHVCAVALTTS